MAEKKKQKKQSPGSTSPVHYPGTISPVSLPVGATGPGLPSNVNPLIAGAINTPYWQQQYQQNPASVMAAFSPPALNQLSQFYAGQNLGGAMPNPNNPNMPGPGGFQPLGQSQNSGGVNTNLTGPLQHPQIPLQPAGGVNTGLTGMLQHPQTPLMPVTGGNNQMQSQGGKGQMGQIGHPNAQGQLFNPGPGLANPQMGTKGAPPPQGQPMGPQPGSPIRPSLM